MTGERRETDLLAEAARRSEERDRLQRAAPEPSLGRPGTVDGSRGPGWLSSASVRLSQCWPPGAAQARGIGAVIGKKAWQAMVWGRGNAGSVCPAGRTATGR